MTQYPLVFHAVSESTQGIQSPWRSLAGKHQSVSSGSGFACAIPPEFDGPGQGSSPEDFFILAMLNCYIATLKVVAEKSKLTFETLNGSGRLTLNKNQAGEPGVESVDLRFSAAGVVNEERFRRLMERVSKQCMMINAVKATVSFHFSVNGVD